MSASSAATSLADYHVHSGFSDGTGEIGAIVARALELGLAEVGVSDHLVPRSLDFDGYGMAHGRIDSYLEAVRAAGAGTTGRLRVLAGVEVDYAPDTAAETDALLDAHGFDYTICSVHHVDGFPFDMEETLDDAGWADPDALVARYCELLTEAAASGRYDVAGHLDLPKKFARRPAGDLSAAWAAALDAIAGAGMALELNTTGLHDPAAEIYPSAELVTAAHERRIPIVFGSDAHHPTEVGRDLAVAVAVARAAGYRSCLRLSDRREVPLPTAAAALGGGAPAGATRDAS